MNTHTDQFGTPLMSYEDIVKKQLSTKGADDKVYKDILDGKYLSRNLGFVEWWTTHKLTTND